MCKCRDTNVDILIAPTNHPHTQPHQPPTHTPTPAHLHTQPTPSHTHHTPTNTNTCANMPATQISECSEPWLRTREHYWETFLVATFCFFAASLHALLFLPALVWRCCLSQKVDTNMFEGETPKWFSSRPSCLTASLQNQRTSVM